VDNAIFLPSTKDVIIFQKEARRKSYEISLKQDREELSYLIKHMRQGPFKSLKSAKELAQSVITKQKIIDIKGRLV